MQTLCLEYALDKNQQMEHGNNNYFKVQIREKAVENAPSIFRPGKKLGALFKYDQIRCENAKQKLNRITILYFYIHLWFKPLLEG